MAISESPPATPGDASLAAVFRIDAFRGLWVANVLAAIATGSSRFAFVWLIGDLTDWDPALALLGVVIGLPALLLSAHAGGLADRLAPRPFGVTMLVSTSVVFAGTALLVPTAMMTVPVALACAFLSAVPIAGTTPLFQALVPAVVPRDRLLPAVALQNMGMMSAVILGAFLGGGIIALFGVAAGFWVIAVSSALAAVQYGRTPLPSGPPSAGVHRKGAVREGMRMGLGTEPLRSLSGPDLRDRHGNHGGDLADACGGPRGARGRGIRGRPVERRDGAWDDGHLAGGGGPTGARLAPGWSSSSCWSRPSAPVSSCWAGRGATRCRWPSSSDGVPSAASRWRCCAP